ncbi:hypothetical protein AFLA_002960 [Aspergillus flavus NRRL3357]|nr:hypothetical protein AFLA_002960 [Aspergillus flavus NRRL3357]
MNRSIGFPAHPSEILLDVLHVHFYTISTVGKIPYFTVPDDQKFIMTGAGRNPVIARGSEGETQAKEKGKDLKARMLKDY